MRGYNAVSPSFWTRGSGKRLRGNAHAQLVGLYLITCPSANMLGLFYLPLATLCHETGLTGEQARAALRACSDAAFAFYDEVGELAWIPNHAEKDIGTSLGSKDKRRPMIERELAGYGDHRYVREFYARYGSAYGLEEPTLSAPAQLPLPVQLAPVITLHPSQDAPSAPDTHASEAPRSGVVRIGSGSGGFGGVCKTPPPDRLDVDETLRMRCAESGALEPTPQDVADILNLARRKGDESPDWRAYVASVMKTRRRLAMNERARAGPAPTTAELDAERSRRDAAERESQSRVRRWEAEACPPPAGFAGLFGSGGEA